MRSLTDWSVNRPTDYLVGKLTDRQEERKTKRKSDVLASVVNAKRSMAVKFHQGCNHSLKSLLALVFIWAVGWHRPPSRLLLAPTLVLPSSANASQYSPSGRTEGNIVKDISCRFGRQNHFLAHLSSVCFLGAHVKRTSVISLSAG